MTKPREAGRDADPRGDAQALLLRIADATDKIDENERMCRAEVEKVENRYRSAAVYFRDALKRDAAALVALMKRHKRLLFDGTDVVNLPAGSLVRTEADKVTIPRKALERCIELALDDAIKTVKSLDREAVEKWPDERLFLIGAKREPREEFSYDLRKGEGTR
jgi:hypothetical protein